jgi:hypothetical protein
MSSSCTVIEVEQLLFRVVDQYLMADIGWDGGLQDTGCGGSLSVICLARGNAVRFLLRHWHLPLVTLKIHMIVS